MHRESGQNLCNKKLLLGRVKTVSLLLETVKPLLARLGTDVGLVPIFRKSLAQRRLGRFISFKPFDIAFTNLRRITKYYDLV